jgi:hypothetical protein
VNSEFDCALTVQGSNVFIPFGLPLSEKQIPLYNVGGVVKIHCELFEPVAGSRALAEITQRGVHPPWHAAVARRCAASG